MKSLIQYIRKNKHKSLSLFINEARLTEGDIEQIQNTARYWADSICLKYAAIEFFNMILKNEDKDNVIDFMHSISLSVSKFNDKVPKSLIKYSGSSTNVTDSDWRGWYTSIKGYVTRKDWFYDNQGEKNDFYDKVCSDGGDTQWTAFNKKALEHLYDMFMEFFNDKSILKDCIKEWKNDLKDSKTRGAKEVKEKIDQIKNFKNPNNVPQIKEETIEDKIRRAEFDIKGGKSCWKEYQAIIHLVELLISNKQNEATDFLYKALRSLEFFKCDYPDYLKEVNITDYDDLSIRCVTNTLYRNLLMIMKNNPKDIREMYNNFYEKIGISENDKFLGKYNKDVVEKIIEVILDTAGNTNALNKLIDKLKKLCDDDFEISSAKRSYDLLKHIKAKQEMNKTDINDKQK